MSKKLFYSCVCSALVMFSAYAQEETIPVQEDELKKEEVLVQADAQEEELIIEEETKELACGCKKRKKGKQTVAIQFATIASETDEEIKEENIEDEALAWSNFNIFIHDATF